MSVEKVTVSNNGIEISDQKSSMKAEKLIIATGAYTRPLAEIIGDSISIEAERGYHMMFPLPYKLIVVSARREWRELICPISHGNRNADDQPSRDRFTASYRHFNEERQHYLRVRASASRHNPGTCYRLSR